MARARDVLMLAGCVAGLAHGASAETRIDWPTFGGSPQRTGYNPSETVLSTSTVPKLKLHWSAALPSKAKYQPSLMRRVVTAKGTLDLLIVTLPNGNLSAYDAATGTVVWSVTLPPTTRSCNGATYSEGIGEPATIDVRKGLLYVVDAGGLLHALSVSDGTELAGYPVEIIDSPNLPTTWVHYASPTLLGRTLYIGTAASCESTKASFHGQLIAFDTRKASVAGRYYPLDDQKLGGGFWGVGGVAAEPDGTSLWGGTANALPAPQDTGNAEKIVQLDPGLNLLAVQGPMLNPGGDLDFGSTPLLFQPTGCPPMLAAENKSGVVVVYDRTNLASGAMQSLQVSAGGGSSKLIGMPAFDPVTDTVFVSNPLDSTDGTYKRGLLAFRAGAGCQLSLAWQQTIGESASVGFPAPPTVANGVVWYAGGNAGQLYAFDASTGAALWNSGPQVRAPAIAAPVVVNGQVFVQGSATLFAFGL